MPENPQNEAQASGHTEWEPRNPFKEAWEDFEPLTPKIQGACDDFNQAHQDDGLSVDYACNPYIWGNLTGSKTREVALGTDTSDVMSPEDQDIIEEFAISIANKHNLNIKPISIPNSTKITYALIPKI